MTKNRKIELPLIDKLNDETSLKLFDDGNMIEIPNFVKNNLKHKLRPYQEQALINLAWTQDLSNNQSNYLYKHLLFNMATGSGKTDVMAAIILYMYGVHKYQNFLFVVNSNSVLAKTRDNLIHSNSIKYLFNSYLTINGQKIEIKEVTSFPSFPELGVIYLKLSTIQNLSNELSVPKENGLTYDNLENQKLIILADEAHHFSSETKSVSDKKSTSWEHVLDRVRQSNSSNKQFEFTATIDLQNENIYNKYKNNIVYKYDLSRFIYEGYSKKVYRIQANGDDMSKMLNVVLLSQYRREIAKQLNIPDFKPIILFKSNRVKSSKEAEELFNRMISELNVTDLRKFLDTQKHNIRSKALSLTYDYWLSQNLANAIVKIKHDFGPLNIINANDGGRKSMLEDADTYKKLNNLESNDNPFRVIFAVAKLSEGWDVLNLYDIVRIGEQPITPKQTNSEAQLIGRGARYNPFIYNEHKSYTRRFDNTCPEYELLESLHYHTINDPKYLKNLKKSLDKLDLPVEDDNDFDVFETELKPAFKSSKTYKHGFVYRNTLEPIPEKEYDRLSRYGINADEQIMINMVNATLESSYNDAPISNINDLRTENRVLNCWTSNYKDLRIIKKAMARNSFYRFNNLKSYLPLLKSLREFIVDPKWLGSIRIKVTVLEDSEEMTRQQELIAVEKVLNNIQSKIVKNYKKNRGTNEFFPIPIKDVVHDYKKLVPRRFNNIIGALIRPHSMQGKPWFIFNDAIVDDLEKSMIDDIGTFAERLNRDYSNVYLIRLDENTSNVKLHQFEGDIYNYQGFLPDFILMFDSKEYNYQIYIEPKGEQLLEKDAWKEKLLESIRPDNIEVIGENNNVKLYGVRFYTRNDGRNIEKEIFNDILK